MSQSDIAGMFAAIVLLIGVVGIIFLLGAAVNESLIQLGVGASFFIGAGIFYRSNVFDNGFAEVINVLRQLSH